jgi:hypothetical protein
MQAKMLTTAGLVLFAVSTFAQGTAGSDTSKREKLPHTLSAAAHG